MSWILKLSIVIGLLIGCSGKNVKDSVEASDLKAPSGLELPVVVKMTGAGINYQPSWSPDGSQLIYISSDRPSHDNPQVYTMQVADKSEKRITWQDGKASHPLFSPDGRRVIYASTTDEAKEDTNFIKDSLERIAGQAEKKPEPESFWQEQPFEIYSSLRNGSRIERLTKSRKYDSEVSIEPKDKRMVFISSRDGALNLHLASTTGTYVKALTKTKNVKSDPAYSPDGLRISWVEYAEGMTSSDIFVGDNLLKEKKAITDSKAIHFQPSWNPDNQFLIFSSNRDDANNYELYAIKADGSCLQRLTWHSSNDTEPAFSPDGKSYVFTSDRSGEKQIYKSEFVKTRSCD